MAYEKDRFKYSFNEINEDKNQKDTTLNTALSTKIPNSKDITYSVMQTKAIHKNDSNNSLFKKKKIPEGVEHRRG